MILRIFLGLLIFLFGAVGFVMFEGMRFLNTAPSQNSDPIVFEVVRGETLHSVARRLENQGLIKDAFRFRLYARFEGKSQSLRVGEYSLNQSMFPSETLEVITSGRSIERSLTFQEGLNRYDMAELVASYGISSAKDFLKVTENKALIQKLLGESHESLEGYLYPETYNVTKYTSVEDLVTMMVKRFLSEYSKVKNQWTIEGFNRHQVVTLASIVEKETGAGHERPIIASVFHNRLRKRMRLQTDPTVLYGILDETHVMPKNIRKRDLLRPTRYNTYTQRGLPFGPISNPGKDALLGTVRPSQTRYLYFVSRNDGTHIFSTNYKDHQKAVAKYQLNAAARRGKSWRDLKQ